MKYPIGAMTVGDVLSRGLKLLFARLGLFYGIMLLVELPVLALQLAMPDFMVNGLGALVLLLPALVFQTIGTGAMIRVIMQEYLGRPVSFGEAFQFALGRFGGLLGTSILVGLFVFLGGLACLIPGIYLGVIYSLSSQVVIVEDRVGMNALGRSQALVEGHFWRVFGTLFLLGLCGGVAGAVVGGLASLALPYQEIVRSASPFGAVRVGNYPNFAITTVITTLVQIFFQTYTGICTTLLYFDLRNRKEAFDLELEAEKINVLVERFGARARPSRVSGQPGDTGIQQQDEGIQPPGGSTAPPGTGIQPAGPDAPPPAGPGPLP
jgi:hypothetical protein